MPEKSEPTLIAEAISERMYEEYLVLKEAWKTPFLMQGLTPGEYKTRFMAMTVEQRQAEIDRLGASEVLKRTGGATT